MPRRSKSNTKTPDRDAPRLPGTEATDLVQDSDSSTKRRRTKPSPLSWDEWERQAIIASNRRTKAHNNGIHKPGSDIRCFVCVRQRDTVIEKILIRQQN